MKIPWFFIAITNCDLYSRRWNRFDWAGEHGENAGEWDDYFLTAIDKRREYGV